MNDNYDLLRKHATPRQIEILNALETANGNKEHAAKALKCSRSTVRAALLSAQERAAKVAPAMHNNEAPPGYLLRGVSTMRDAEGNKIVEWVKTTRDSQNVEAILEAFKAAVAADPPRVRTIIPPAPDRVASDDLLTVYPMGDPHLGMLAWGVETGTDFDIKIAERNLVSAVDRLVSLAPPSKRALIVNLGDFFHSDNKEARTARSGHSLDVDSRWAKILRIGVMTMVRCIDRALEKHDTVRVVCEIGNHDDHSSVMLAICLAHHYIDNTRVEIDTSPSPFHWYEFGKCLIGITHGHNTKADKLPGIMAYDQAEAWGRTQFRQWYTGHVHHESVKEYPGVLVETFRTLASRDAWHHGQGYRSGRSMVLDVWHKDRGRILRHEVGVEQLSQV